MLEEQLKKFFDYEYFRPGQKEVISSLMEGKDTLAILPTGTGKSLCYQMTGYLKEGLVLIVSPLISLMEDQVDSLLRLGEKRAIAINSTLQNSEKEFVLQHLKKYKFVFLSPEMLAQEKVIDTLRKQKIALFVVDEAHCISQWGIDFRPEYRNLGLIKEKLGSPLTLALTGSATKKVKHEILQLLLTQDANEIVYSMDRPNIALFVHQTASKYEDLRELMEKCPGPGLIYCATRKQVETLYSSLKNDFSLGFYHGGLTSNQRRMLQKQFNDDQLQFLIATNAFGMGIDKGNICRIIHYDLPDSLENYLQEIGRAGRDGSLSDAILLYKEGDEKIHYYFQQKTKQQRQMFETALGNGRTINKEDIQQKWLEQGRLEGMATFRQRLEVNEEQKYKKLMQMLDYIKDKGCHRHFLMTYFQEKQTKNPENCCDFHGAKLIEKTVGEKQVVNENLAWQEILLKLFKTEN